MARVKITEHKAKELIYSSLALPYSAITINTETSFDKKLSSLSDNKKYVLKVDQGVKGRMKKGLVKLNLKKEELKDSINSLSQKGYSRFIIEQMAGAKSKEQYISFERKREGIRILYAQDGGIEIEKNKNIQTIVVDDESDKKLKTINISQTDLKKLLELFSKYHFTFLEINPFIVEGSKIIPLDAAVEVDTAGEFFAHGAWTEKDVVSHNTSTVSAEEKSVEQLAKKSQASFNLTVLNPNGKVFLLLSGGGASIVIADEAAALGYGKEVANYGEYSGNPNEEETYIYTKNLLKLMLNSKARKKVLILAGGVANFTDVKATFKGIIKAIEETKHDLKKQHIKVFVRRGGPNQEEGLRHMKDYLEKNSLYGLVAGPDLILTEIVKKAVQTI